MRFVYDDGGRKAAGFVGKAGDCVARAVAIATEQPYARVYARLAAGMGAQRATRGKASTASARNGVDVKRKWFKDYLAGIGWTWTPTMGIGTGCRVHLTDGELPAGRLIVVVSRHYTAVLDGVIHDTHDPQRGGEMTFDSAGNLASIGGGRCVYGYWQRAPKSPTRDDGQTGGPS